MKTSPLTVALVAVLSSLATVGALELWRGSRPIAPPALAVEASAEPSRSSGSGNAAEPLAPSRTEPAAVDLSPVLTSLAELERRIAALETSPQRAPVTTPASEEDELRERVLEWVAADREARGRDAKLLAEEEAEKQREFSARFQAYMLKEEHDLTDWEEERLYEVFLATKIREEEVEKVVSQLDDPEEAEARWLEFDEWVERLEREGMGQELWDKLAWD